jgi:asparagine synthase (glutamine-hydrolysing)
MPGIVGLITGMPREQAERQLRAMLATMRHETSYHSSIWIDESLGVYIGSVERAGAFADSMPVSNERGDAVLIFSGEEFPAPGSAQALKEQVHDFDPTGPSYLVHQYEQLPEFPANLNGRFHGLVADRRNNLVTLFNDRYGMHRIYYHEAREAFYFAAEAKAILAVRPELRATDPRGLAEFITCGCTLENRSLFQGIYLLPPASAWIFRNRQPERKRVYFDSKQWEEQSPLDPESYYQQLREVFARNLPRYFAGPEKVGVSLTGGLDSRMIMAWHHAAPGTLPCYSFGGVYRDCQDVTIGRKVARACSQPHQVIRVGDEFLAQFPYYSERAVYLTDGCVEVQSAPDVYVNERAAQIAPARMTGNYGGEVLRRVRAFKPSDPEPGLFHSDLSANFDNSKTTFNSLLDCHPLSFAVFRQAPWHHYGLLSLEQTQVALRSPYLDNELVQTVYRAPLTALASDDISLRLIKDGNPSLLKIRTDRGLAGRLPAFAARLQQSYLEFTAKAEYAYDYGMPHAVARVDHTFAALHFERLFLGRHKFYHFRVWYRDALANYVREMLLDSRTLNRPYLRRETLERMVKAHLKGDRNYTNAIHKILTLEHIHRLFIDPQ